MKTTYQLKSKRPEYKAQITIPFKQNQKAEHSIKEDYKETVTILNQKLYTPVMI